MKVSLTRRILFGAVSLMLIVGLSNCGKKDTPPAPMPYIPPQTNNNLGGGYYGGGSCGSPGGFQPIDSRYTQPYVADLFMTNGQGSAVHHMNIMVNWADQMTSNVLGSANMTLNFAMLPPMNYGPNYGDQQMQQPFCVSSSYSGQPSPGSMSYRSLNGQQTVIAIHNLTMRGQAYVPQVSPYNPYPSQGNFQFMPENVTVRLGYGCDSWLNTTTRRIGGCVHVILGTSQHQFWAQ